MKRKDIGNLLNKAIGGNFTSNYCNLNCFICHYINLKSCYIKAEI